MADAARTGFSMPTPLVGSDWLAAADAFVLTLLGHANVALYDGSLAEWTADPELPMETG